MLSRILVPLDGSPLAEAVLPEVVELAALRRAEVLLLRVAVAHAHPGLDPVEAQVRAIEESQAYLKGIETRLAAQGLPVKSAVRYGQAAEEIFEHARIESADLIAMSTHGRSGIRRWVLGSVAETVVRRSPTPVLLLRAKDAIRSAADVAPPPEPHPVSPMDASAAIRIRHILCPVDLSPAALGVMESAGVLAQRFGAELTVLHAIYDPLDAGHPYVPHPPLAHLREEMMRIAEETLRGQMGRALGSPPRASLTVVAGSPLRQIIRFARERGVDLIVIGTKGRGGPDHLISGNTAEQVVRTAPCPVLSIRVAA
jgi:nucleotide-binding universal stress UspA family protein